MEGKPLARVLVFFNNHDSFDSFLSEKGFNRTQAANFGVKMPIRAAVNRLLARNKLPLDFHVVRLPEQQDWTLVMIAYAVVPVFTLAEPDYAVIMSDPRTKELRDRYYSLRRSNRKSRKTGAECQNSRVARRELVDHLTEMLATRLKRVIVP